MWSRHPAHALEWKSCEIYGPSDIDIFKNSLITIFPNPFYDKISIKGLPGKYLTFELYDLSGRKIYQENILYKDIYQITTTFLNQGIYLVRIIDRNNMEILRTQLILKR